MNKLPNIALVGDAPENKHELLNALLAEEDLGDVCTVTLYGADGQEEQEALRDAIADWRGGRVDGIVCLPMSLTPRKIIREQLNDEAANATAVYVNNAIKMVSVKGDVNAGDVEASLTSEDLKEKVLQTAKAMKRDFLVLNPRIAIVSLNAEITPDAGNKEIAVIAPTISELVKEGTQAFGPIPYTTFFDGTNYQAYDAVVEMYDKQCMEEFAKSGYDDAFTLFSNITIPMAFAHPEAVLQAIFTVIDVERNRREYDAPFANPLPKLYHERKEDGEKARFAVKKKGFNPAEHRHENVPYPVVNPALTGDFGSSQAKEAAVSPSEKPASTPQNDAV